jgi:hypothetical protein
VLEQRVGERLLLLLVAGRPEPRAARRRKRAAVIVARRYADGVLTRYPKTERRRVPLSARALSNSPA